MALTFLPNDVNRNGSVTGGDSLLMNQYFVGLRNTISSVCDPPTKDTTESKDITIYGLFGAPITGVTITNIGPAGATVTCTNVVKVDNFRVTCTVPTGGVAATGTVSMTGTGLTGAAHFATFQNGVPSSTDNPAPTQFSGLGIYAADNAVGLMVFDATDPTALGTPSLANLDFQANHASVSGTIAVSTGSHYIATNTGVVSQKNGFCVFGLLNPAWPKLLSVYEEPDSTIVYYGVATDGDYAYCACGTKGLRIFDITTPETPVLVGTLVTSGGVSLSFANHVFKSGNYCYVSSSASGLRIVDVTTPSSPTLTGYFNREAGQTYGIRRAMVYNDIAYCAATSALVLLDVSNPAAPAKVGQQTTSAQDVYVTAANRVFVAASTSGCNIYDCTTPGSISSLANVPIIANSGVSNNAKTLSCYVNGNYLYLANFDGGIAVYDISTIGTPVYVCSALGFGEVNSVIGATT